MAEAGISMMTSMVGKRSSEEPSSQGATKHGQKGDKGKGSSNSSGASAKEIQQLGNLVTLIGKLTLQGAREIATLKAILVRTIISPKEEELNANMVDKVKEATQGYYEATKGLPNSQRKDYRPPHSMAWLALCNYLLESKGLLGEVKAKEIENLVQEHVKQVKQQAMELGKATGVKVEGEGPELGRLCRHVIADTVKVCKVSKTFNPKDGRLEIQAMANTAAYRVTMEIVGLIIVHSKGQLKNSQAPRNDLERRIQAMINNES
eukprot:TRINITY_DN34134_c0_g1_i1.p1 TRINITY_DN34134_c0_g1~~TRINITY_DN34134_c0_g1_i1.p1  ORF type:complete len:263 (+),score=89.69 TRINITY_DN34134_c0_g1_i1:121-909(+)